MAGRDRARAAGKRREGRTESDPRSELLSIRPRYNTIKKAPPRGLGTRLAVTDGRASTPTDCLEGGRRSDAHRAPTGETGGREGENAAAARSWLPISQPTPAALISLGGTAAEAAVAVAGGPKGTTREAGLLPPRTEKRRRSLALRSSDFELWKARRGGREGGREARGGRGQ